MCYQKFLHKITSNTETAQRLNMFIQVKVHKFTKIDCFIINVRHFVMYTYLWKSFFVSLWEEFGL